MFERNRVDTSTDAVSIDVQITLDDGEAIAGNMRISRSRDLTQTLNSPDTFIVFAPYDGEAMLLAKSAIRRVKPLQPCRVERLMPANPSSHQFDPHATLGVSKSATWDEIRSAYHALSMVYHPDRYTNAELPEEVRTYLAGMARNINTAYSVLEAICYRPVARTRPVAAPVYERHGI